MSVLAAIVALCLAIVVHEFGHYLCARATGMRVDRFSVLGIGPPIARLGHVGETELVIGAIPFGAYVQIHGMEPTDPAAPPPPPDPRSYRDKPVWARLLALCGGPLANYVGASVVLLAVFAGAGVSQPEALEIRSFSPVSAARDAGLQERDELVRIGETRLDPLEGLAPVVQAGRSHLGQSVEVEVRRQGNLHTHVLQLPTEGQPLGVELAVRPGPRVPLALPQAATLAVVRPVEITLEQLSGLTDLILGRISADLEGPVGIVRHIADSFDEGWPDFLLTIAYVSTLLGMFNLLPLPALDGGRIVFLLVGVALRRAPSPRIEELVHGVGMLALLALIAVVTVGDIFGP